MAQKPLYLTAEDHEWAILSTKPGLPAEVIIQRDDEDLVYIFDQDVIALVPDPVIPAYVMIEALNTYKSLGEALLQRHWDRFKREVTIVHPDDYSTLTPEILCQTPLPTF